MSDYELIDALYTLAEKGHKIDLETIDIFKDYTNEKERQSILRLCEQVTKVLRQIK
jgi:hypothetical protein